MSTEHNNKDLHDAIGEVLRRASLDIEFRKLALKDAAAAIAQVTAQRIHDGIQVRFVENTDNSKTVILPEFSSRPENLSEQELDHVAGGCDIATCVMTM